MTRRILFGAVLAFGVVSAPRPTAAQQRPSLSVEATVGPVQGYTGGEYLRDRRAAGLDLLLGARAGAAGTRGIVFGANASLHYAGAHTLACRRATVEGGCIPQFPFFQVAGALVGWENASTTLRLMGGPAWAHAEADALAWQARLDGALPAVWRLALVGSVRGTVVPDYRGDAVGLLGLGLGVRLR